MLARRTALDEATIVAVFQELMAEKGLGLTHVARGQRFDSSQAHRGRYCHEMSTAPHDRPIAGPDEARQALLLLNAFLTVQALHTAAVLGLADLIPPEGSTTSELADSTGTNPDALNRLLRMLAANGLFRETAERRFLLTPLGRTLASTGDASVRDWALFVGAPEMWQVWSGMSESVRSGQAAFNRTHGKPLWQFLAERPELGAAFHRWMTRQSEQHNAALVAAYDFSQHRVVADIGGGEGSTLAAILSANSRLQGILLDLPEVVADPSSLSAEGVRQRCQVLGGDMLAEVPGGADAYVIKRVLMDWSDGDSVRILSNCRSAAAAGGKILVVEMLLPEGNDPSPGWSFDLLMLLNQPGGRIRTESEFRRLFAAAGLNLTRVGSTHSPNSIIEGTPL